MAEQITSPVVIPDMKAVQNDTSPAERHHAPDKPPVPTQGQVNEMIREGTEKLKRETGTDLSNPTAGVTPEEARKFVQPFICNIPIPDAAQFGNNPYAKAKLDELRANFAAQCEAMKKDNPSKP